MTLDIDSLHYRSIKKIVQLQNGRVSGANVATLMRIDNFCLYKFSGNIDNSIWFNTTIPHDYEFNTSIDVIIEYFCESSSSGSVEWELIYNASTDVVDTIGTTLPHVTVINAGEKVISNISLTPTISPIVFLANNNVLLLKVTRMGSVDSYSGDVYGLSVYLIYYCDRLTNT